MERAVGQIGTQVSAWLFVMSQNQFILINAMFIYYIKQLFQISKGNKRALYDVKETPE